MALYFYLALFTLAHVALANNKKGNELTIQPNVARMFVREGASKTLNCFFTPLGSPNWQVEWTPEDPSTINYASSANKRTMTISHFSIQDHAKVYICQVKDPDTDMVKLSKNITLIGVKEQKNSPEMMQEEDGSLTLASNLACNISLSDSSFRISGPEWFKKNESIEKVSDKYSIYKDGKALEIKTVTKTDLGVYTAKYQINDGNKDSWYDCEVSINSRPIVDTNYHDGCKNVIEGKKIELKCDIWGYPKPVITWNKGEHPVNVTHGSRKIMLKSVNGYKNAHLVIEDADFDDSGDYTCFAYSKEMNVTKEQKICVGVKDKHAAVIPFLCIVGEVVVLCAIIFVYEKKRNDKAKAVECEATDASNTDVKGKVRNRRQQKS